MPLSGRAEHCPILTLRLSFIWQATVSRIVTRYWYRRIGQSVITWIEHKTAGHYSGLVLSQGQTMNKTLGFLVLASLIIGFSYWGGCMEWWLLGYYIPLDFHLRFACWDFVLLIVFHLMHTFVDDFMAKIYFSRFNSPPNLCFQISNSWCRKTTEEAIGHYWHHKTHPDITCSLKDDN